MFAKMRVAAKTAGYLGAAVVGVSVTLAHQALAGDAVNTGYFGGVAIKGYDPVAYFKQSKAVKGSPEFEHNWLGGTWHFASDENRQTFANDPIAYAPQFGGYCAGEVLYADVSTGVTTNIDPEAWRIVDDKLYIFYDKGYAEAWEKDAAKNIAAANAKWPKVKDKLASN